MSLCDPILQVTLRSCAMDGVLPLTDIVPLPFMCCHCVDFVRVILSESSLSGCLEHQTRGIGFWTAGQRIDPSRESKFVWRVKYWSGDVASEMSYSNWNTIDQPGQPDYSGGNEECVQMLSGRSYTWNDHNCSGALCSVCEIDIP